MSFFRNDRLSSISSSTSLQDDFLTKKILLTHDPDGCHLDSELLLRAVENIMCYTASSEERVSSFRFDGNFDNDITNIEVVGAQESLRQIISKLSCEMLFEKKSEADLHAQTMILFDLLGNYRWDAKVVLVLAAFATSYGRFWLIMQLYPHNPLAVSVAVLKQLPNDLSMFKPRFKALASLVKTMVDVTKYIIRFEGLPFKHVQLDDETMAISKSYIYLSSYWVIRSTLACSSQITDLIAMKPEQVLSTTVAAWQLSSLVYRLRSIFSCLNRQVDSCHRQIETKLYQKLLDLFQDVHSDNQEILGMLLALKDGLPLKHSSTQAKLGISELKDKLVVLLVSNPKLLPLEELILLIHQTYDHPQRKQLEKSYEVVWIPISFSDTWTDSDAESFNLLSDFLPWYSIRQPWLLNSAILKYIQQEWNFKEDPLMVVLDSQGSVTNNNAIDMVLIWGAKAFPFSSSREKQLWEEENWTLQFLLDDIDPLLTRWVEERRNICIYGSENLEWIIEFNAKLKIIRNSGVELEMVYVGSRNLTEIVKHNLAVINKEMHGNSLSFTKLHFFWLRLESMRRSILRTGGENPSSDHILERVSGLLESPDEGWAAIGKGSKNDLVKFEGNRLMDCLNKFSEWDDNVAELGLMEAIRIAMEPTPPPEICKHTRILPYEEGLLEGTIACDKCKRPMKKFTVYE